MTISIGEKYGNGRGAGVTSLVNGISGVGAIIEGRAHFRFVISKVQNYNYVYGHKNLDNLACGS